MKIKKIYRVKFVLCLSVCLILTTCSFKRELSYTQESSNDFSQIKKRGRIVAIIEENSSDYFIYKGEPMGFQFELLTQLGSFLGVEVEIIVSSNMDDDFLALYQGKADIIAKSHTPNHYRTDILSYSIPLYSTSHVLVERKDEELNAPADLKTTGMKRGNIYVPLRSAFSETLDTLKIKSDKALKYFEMPGYTAEQLVELVSGHQLDYTVCNKEQAKILKYNYPNLDFSKVLSENNPVSWIMRKKSSLLQTKINDWLSFYRSSAQFAAKFDKYFEKRESYRNISHRYVALREKQISQFDNAIKKYSRIIDWDWRLLASLIYQESRFNPRVVSHAGAYGLMQLMPRTRAHFGVDQESPIEKQIEAGVKYIRLLDRQIASRVPDKKERIKFILASYNIGWGHILDAVNIAGKTGRNSRLWDLNVDSCLLSKSDPKILSMEEVKHGYANGRETYRFVKQIMERYEHYKNLVD